MRNTSDSAIGDISSKSVGRNIKNLSTVANLAKSKKSDLAKSKRLILAKSKNLDLPKANFVKVNSFGANSFTLKTKKIFIHLQKAFIKTLIQKYFDLKVYIWIRIGILGYAISMMLSQMNLNKLFFNSKIYKHLASISPKSEIG